LIAINENLHRADQAKVVFLKNQRGADTNTLAELRKKLQLIRPISGMNLNLVAAGQIASDINFERRYNRIHAESASLLMDNQAMVIE
jgi:hypothetical protein